MVGGLRRDRDLFGGVGGVWVIAGHQWGGQQYFAGYITEKALSVDNLFVFLIIMSSFKVPRADQQKVLLFGITFSLIARTAFIFVGAALINQFAWVFYIFGAILIFMAGKQVSEEFSSDSGDDDADNVMTRFFRKYLRTSEHYDGDKMVTTVNGKRMLTPMLLVMLSIGGTDLLFALDSIPAIFGLTQETYLVFTAVVFSLLGGLRQLYFLIDGLLDRLVYLTWGGLAAILAFIGGVKLILHALHENNVPFINGGGEPVQVVEISTGLSLAVIIGVLVITVIASLISPRGGRIQSYVANARRHARLYLDTNSDEEPAVKAEAFRSLLAEERQIKELDDKKRALIREESELMDLIRRAHEEHAHYIETGRVRPDSGYDPFWEESSILEEPTERRER